MRKKVVLACVECGSRNYSTTSNKKTQTERLELKNIVVLAVCKRFIAKQNKFP